MTNDSNHRDQKPDNVRVDDLDTKHDPKGGYLIKMKPVYITSYQTGGSSGDDVPTETLSLNYTKVE